MTERLDYTKLQKRLEKLAKDNPAWFDMSLRILKLYHDNEQTLLGAIMTGMIEAHAFGLEKTLPPEDEVMKRARAGEANPANYIKPGTENAKPVRVARKKS